MVEHFYVKFGDPSCIDFWDSTCKKTERQTQKLRWNLPTRLYRRSW